MKTTHKKRNIVFLTAVLAITLVLGFMWTGCSNPAGGPPATVLPGEATYASKTASGDTYTLAITENTGRAAYTPKNGDRYILTIVSGSTTKTSAGEVTGYDSGTGEFELSSDAGGSPFKVTVSGESITGIVGPIILTNGDSESAPSGPLTAADPDRFSGRYIDEGMYEDSMPAGFFYNIHDVVITGTSWLLRYTEEGYEGASRVQAVGTLTPVTGSNNTATIVGTYEDDSESLTASGGPGTPISGTMTLNGDSLTLKVISGSQEFTLPYTKNPDLGFDGTYTASNYKLGIVGKGFLFYENNQCIGSGILKKNSNTAIDITILATKQGDPDLFVGTGTFSGTGSGSTLTLTGSGSLGSGPFTLTKQ